MFKTKQRNGLISPMSKLEKISNISEQKTQKGSDLFVNK